LLILAKVVKFCSGIAAMAIQNKKMIFLYNLLNYMLLKNLF